MGGGDLNLKKSWHPATLRNQEKVWKKEREAEEERKKMDQLLKEKNEERQMMELQALSEAAGKVKKRTERLDWMYSSAGGGNKAVDEDREAYLLGKKRVDKLVEQGKTIQEIESSASFDRANVYGVTANTVRDTQAKIREDPLLAIKKREHASLQAVLNNPVELKKLKEAKSGKKDRGSKKDKKEKKHKREKKKRVRDEDSDSDSSQNTELRRAAKSTKVDIAVHGRENGRSNGHHNRRSRSRSFGRSTRRSSSVERNRYRRRSPSVSGGWFSRRSPSPARRGTFRRASPSASIERTSRPSPSPVRSRMWRRSPSGSIERPSRRSPSLPRERPRRKSPFRSPSPVGERGGRRSQPRDGRSFRSPPESSRPNHMSPRRRRSSPSPRPPVTDGKQHDTRQSPPTPSAESLSKTNTVLSTAHAEYEARKKALESERERRLAEMMNNAQEWDAARTKRVEEERRQDAEEHARDMDARMKRLERAGGAQGESFLRDLHRQTFSGESASAADMIRRNKAFAQRAGGFLSKS
ncbi:U2-type spliceosomal complex subunit CWC25 [Spizellomyces punctatus DAOM BR117]|uniref:CBF1-interacting co-repressor CIR N-terminal domain-containing protein n=1 Tax=Spizellomyces punctatus (strain DAOM BR117) TaxID=645134 RepID=A0A0L0H6P1_SPIPD|nr:U2-type spliceosomal complex subunit CWC25 [Spizellomyces punctatus DAOM BR117]KNC97160.1 hypothetical protein SPPG_07550 [Spizellomyces punctatus DAOM BR117]|eukprot:XP_016605200.1 hypothetical protein SPPG_07550 [Spizellomyces punctatus DAOM BR117]